MVLVLALCSMLINSKSLQLSLVDISTCFIQFPGRVLISIAIEEGHSFDLIGHNSAALCPMQGSCKQTKSVRLPLQLTASINQWGCSSQAHEGFSIPGCQGGSCRALRSMQTSYGHLSAIYTRICWIHQLFRHQDHFQQAHKVVQLQPVLLQGC